MPHHRGVVGTVLAPAHLFGRAGATPGEFGQLVLHDGQVAVGRQSVPHVVDQLGDNVHGWRWTPGKWADQVSGQTRPAGLPGGRPQQLQPGRLRVMGNAHRRVRERPHQREHVGGGGGIANSGTLTLSNITLSGNSATASGAGAYAA